MQQPHIPEQGETNWKHGWQPPPVAVSHTGTTPNPNKTKPFWNWAFLKRINFHIILIDNHHRQSGRTTCNAHVAFPPDTSTGETRRRFRLSPGQLRSRNSFVAIVVVRRAQKYRNARHIVVVVRFDQPPPPLLSFDEIKNVILITWFIKIAKFYPTFRRARWFRAREICLPKGNRSSVVVGNDGWFICRA